MSTTFKSAAETYLRAKGLSRGTRNEYTSTMRKWERWGGGGTIEQLRRKDVREFLDWVHEEAVKDGGANPGRTANKAREHLRAVLSWAWEQELIEAPRGSPGARLQCDAAGRHYLTKAEINALYFATHSMAKPRGWDVPLPIGRYWRSTLVVFFNYGVDTRTIWESTPAHEPILWRHISWDRRSPGREVKEQSPWGWLFYRRVKTGKAFHRACCPAAMHRAPGGWGSRGREVTEAAEQDRPELKAERAAWRGEFATVDLSRLVFVDESGATTAMDRTHGRCASGKRVDGPLPHGHWLVTTLTAAVRLGGVPEPACVAFVGATDAMAFETYAERCLAPALRPGDIVVMDNLGSHKRPPPIAAIEAAGAAVRFLPPHSPDLNPIEKMFSKLKAYLRKVKARKVEALHDALGDGLQTVTESDIAGCFKSCGYRQAQ